MSSTEPTTEKALADTKADSTDNTSEPITDKKPAAAPKARKKEKKTSNKSRSGASWLFIILLLSAAGGAYYYWLQLQQTIDKLSADNAFQNSKLTAVANKLEQTRADAHQHQEDFSKLSDQIELQLNQIKALDDSYQTLIQTSKNIFDITHRNQRQWLLSEVSYLLSLANQRLLVSRDIRTAIAALKAANHRLHDLGDPGLISLRKKIADEISQLNLLKQPDITGTAFNLDNFSVSVQQLPFKSAQQKHIEQNQAAEPVELATIQEDNLLSPLWERIKTLVSIKKHSRDIQPTDSVAEKYEIDNQLRYRIEAARLALININTRVFNHEISKALELVSVHYDQNDNRVTTLLTELEPLATLDLLPEFPDISGSWTLLQRYIATHNVNNSLNNNVLKKNKGNSIK